MNKLTRNFILVLTIVLFLTACGGAEAPSAPEVSVTEEPTSLPEPVDDMPTAVPFEETDSAIFGKYIGMIYPPSPENLTQVFSMLIQNKEDHSLMMVLDGGSKMLWLSRLDRYDESGNAFWEVKDILLLSDLETGLTLIPDGCSLNGTLDSEILAAGRNGVIVLAWRANTILDKIESIPVSGIVCNSDKMMPLE